MSLFVSIIFFFVTVNLLLIFCHLVEIVYRFIYDAQIWRNNKIFGLNKKENRKIWTD